MLKYKDKIVTKQDIGILNGDIVIDLQEIGKPEITFTGKPLPQSLWEIISSFFKWTYETHKCESQVRLFYRESDGDWYAEPLPQYISMGLSTEEIKNSPDHAEIIEKILNAGYSPFGTVHHHCNASAFMSGTDYNDEIGQTGLHITIGHLDSNRYSYHARFVLRGIMYENIEIEQFIEPKYLEAPYNMEFPEIWKSRMITKPVFPMGTWGVRESYLWEQKDFIDNFSESVQTSYDVYTKRQLRKIFNYLGQCYPLEFIIETIYKHLDTVIDEEYMKQEELQLWKEL